MQEETKKEVTLDTPEEKETYEEYFAFTEFAVKAGLDEHKRLTVDLNNVQLGHIRQLIYLSITVSTAIAGVIVSTPMWSGQNAPLSSFELFLMFLLGLSFIVAAGSFLYGVRSLRGGDLPIIVKSYGEMTDNALGADGFGHSHQAYQTLLVEIDRANKEFRDSISNKARKIRALNLAILGAASCAAFAVLALFSTTLWSNYEKQRAIEICASETRALQVSAEEQGKSEQTAESAVKERE